MTGISAPTEPYPPVSISRMLYEFYYAFRPNKPTFLPDDYPDLTGKTAIVTGTNSGIGFEVVNLLYEKNCNVIMLAITEAKGVAARNRILKLHPESKGALEVVGCDYSDLSNVKGAFAEIRDIVKNQPISVIIHNAGIMPAINTATSKQGYELIFQTNVLAPQLLQHFLDPLFLKDDSDLKRIVWVTSGAHELGPKGYGINWSNPTFENVPVAARLPAAVLYGQSKCGIIYQANAWATTNKQIVSEINCVSTSCYPGNINTDIQNDWSRAKKLFGKLFFWDAKYGAYSELYSALYPGLTTKNNGSYIAPWGEIHDPREDIKEGLTNGVDVKFWNFVSTKIAPFF